LRNILSHPFSVDVENYLVQIESKVFSIFPIKQNGFWNLSDVPSILFLSAKINLKAKEKDLQKISFFISSNKKRIRKLII